MITWKYINFDRNSIVPKSLNDEMTVRSKHCPTLASESGLTATITNTLQISKNASDILLTQRYIGINLAIYSSRKTKQY